MVLVRVDEEEASGETEEPKRPLLLLVRGTDGALQQADRNDDIVYCVSCGGVMGDPFEGINITPGVLTVSHYGGSSWRWGHSYTFRYSAGAAAWFLDAIETVSFHASEPDETFTEQRFSREELGEVPFAQATPDWGRESRRWTVTAEKAYFYDQPDLHSSPRKAYLIAGDALESHRTTAHFVEAIFTNTAGQSTSGFILRRDLAPAP